MHPNLDHVTTLLEFDFLKQEAPLPRRAQRVSEELMADKIIRNYRKSPSRGSMDLVMFQTNERMEKKQAPK